MQVKLRKVGNSVGLTIPFSELRLANVKAGDVIEFEIKRVISHVRDDWGDSALWPGANDEPLLLEGASESGFDDSGEWEWE